MKDFLIGFLRDMIAGLFTQQALHQAGADPADLSKTGLVEIAQTGYSRDNEEHGQRDAIMGFAQGERGKPYQWGGKTGKPGWDCSGIVTAAYREAGLSMPEGTHDQHAFCRMIKVHGHAPAGDLIFLGPNPHGIGHVLMHTGYGTVIHAYDGRGVVEDPVNMWESHPRYAGTFRHPSFQRSPEER